MPLFLLERKKAKEDWVILDKYITARSGDVFRHFQRGKKSLVNENVTSKYNFGMKSFQAKIENKNELDSLICPSF